MYKIKFYFILLIATITVISCNKADDPEPVEPPRDYATQYAAESVLIETYLKTNYITVVNNPGMPDDQDVTITLIPEGGTQPSILSYLNSPTYPKLLNRIVKRNGVVYSLYYLVLREGVGESPSNVDGVLTAYKGEYLTSTTTSDVTTITSTFFEEVKNPNRFLDLFTQVYVRGWKELFPQFKTGTYNSNNDGTVTYTDFGAGVFFIPSGLAYYNIPQGSSIPAYSPLVFNIKLYSIERLDHEYYMYGNTAVAAPDGVKSFNEDLDGDGYVWINSELPDGVSENLDDFDKDGIPDFLDRDDDADNYATQGEVKDAAGKIYPFDLIPDCSGDQTTPTRKKRYLDKNCIKMSQ